MLLKRAPVAPELGALPREEAADGLTESRILDPVRRVRLHREEAAQELVLALGAGVEAGEPVPDAVLDQAVVADLEVQAAVLLGAAPVAAEEGIAAREAVGAGHVAPAAPREHEEDPIGERRRHRDEEREGQRGVSPFAVVGGAVQRVVRAPVRLGGGVAVVDLDLDRGRRRVPALAPDLLAPLRGERVEVVLEVAVSPGSSSGTGIPSA